jgi:hypothetical protein
MQKFVAAVGPIVAAVAIAVPAGATCPTGSAKLRLLDRAPLTLRGAGFKAGERVSVTATASREAVRRVRALASGGFVVTFTGLTAGRCTLVRAVAVGNRGSRTVLKILPPPACLPS